MGLGYLVLGLGLATGCGESSSKDVGSEIKGSEQPVQVVFVDDLVEGGVEEVVELYVGKNINAYTPDIEEANWTYWGNNERTSFESFGYENLSELVSDVRENVIERDGPFIGLVLHTYGPGVSEEVKNQVVESLGIPKVAYVDERPVSSRVNDVGFEYVEIGPVRYMSLPGGATVFSF